MVSRTLNITNEVYGSLTAVSISHIKNRQAYWNFKCVCGKTHKARLGIVRYESKIKNDPELPSCGCIELSRKTKHGYRSAKNTHPAYKVYRGMLTRCYNPNSPLYKWYGGAGVTIADCWRDNPKAFVDWAISNGWEEGLHIDKDIKCKNLGIYPHIYSPETCQWVTPQANVSAATNRTNYGMHPNVRLSQDDVNKLLQLYFSGEITNKSELARMFGFKSPSSVNRLISIANKAA